MKQELSAKQVKTIISSSKEFCFVDVREIGQHAKGHPFFSISIPFSVFENKIEELTPNKNTLIIIFDQNDGLSEFVYTEAKNLGYNNLYILRDGVFGWEKEGYELFDGINIPSKAFGEWIEEEYRTPHIKPFELAKKIQNKENILVLDGRTIEEYQKMNIPSSVNCPNMEMPVRIKKQINKNTEIIVGCAGRTRSIIGTQNLINYGIENSVKALENGTQGWSLANFKLEHNQNRRVPLSKLNPEKSFIEKAEFIIKKYGIKKINFDDTIKLLREKSITTYIFDVTETKQNISFLPNKIRNVPGGQLIQATDNYIGVWNSKIILLDDGELVRASMTATWLKQMGHSVYVYNDKPEILFKKMKFFKEKFSIDNDKKVKLSKLKNFKHFNMIDIRNSHSYRRSHIVKSRWFSRANLRLMKITKGKDILIIYDDITKAQLVTKTINEKNQVNIFYYYFDKKDITEKPYLFTKSPYFPKTKDCIDFIYHTHKRHNGNRTHAKAYLSWEKTLLNRMDEQELKKFIKL